MSFPYHVIWICIKFQPSIIHLKSINYRKQILRQPSYINIFQWEWHYLFLLKIFLDDLHYFLLSLIFSYKYKVPLLPCCLHILCLGRRIFCTYLVCLKTESIRHWFQWKSYIHDVHPKAVISQAFEINKIALSLKDQIFQTSPFSCAEHAFTDKQWTRLAKTVFVSLLQWKDLFHLDLNFLFPEAWQSLTVIHPAFWLFPITYLPY